MKRDTLRWLIVATLVLGTSAGALAGAAVTTSGEEDASTYTPDHAQCTYNQTRLAEYEPELRRSHLSVQPTALYGAAFVSSERDTDYLVYWARYTHQQGVSQEDSHFGDHEPVYVEVNDDTGEIVSVQYSAYHYLKGSLDRPAAEEFLNGSHMRLYVVKPWHHYQPEKRPGGFTNTDIKDFCDASQQWYNNGWKASKEATMNPWVMNQPDRHSWWEDNALGFSATEIRWRAQRVVADLFSWTWGW